MLIFIFKLLLQFAVLIIGLALGTALIEYLSGKLPDTLPWIVVSCVGAFIGVCFLMKGLGWINNFLMGLF